MVFAYDNDVREHALLENETVLQTVIPEKKAFFFYRAVIPSVILGAAALALLAANIIHTLINGLPFSGAIYIVIALSVVPAILALCAVQKKVHGKRAYYITDKRILLVSGLFHLKYRTLNYRFIGSVTMKRTLFSKLFGLSSYTVIVIMNVSKQFSVKFFSLSGSMLSYLEDPDKTYKLIVRASVDRPYMP